jgi:glycerol-3-phosphate dehydrogenase (NAD(P)+)
MGHTIAVLGAGNAGTTFALLAAQAGHAVRLWTIEPDVAALLRQARENRKYLPGIPLPPAIAIAEALPEALTGADLVLLTVPSHVIRRLARAIAPFLTPAQLVVSIAKGLEEGTFSTMSEVLHQELPAPVRPNIVALSGPSIAREMSRGIPTAVVVAGIGRGAAETVRQALQSPTLRVEVVEDLVGLQLGGALKNVYALAAGLCDGLGGGGNTKAALITHGLGEMVQVGTRLGAQPATLYGLAGLGDLVVTCLAPQSRNRSLGEQLAAGHTLTQLLQTRVEVSEGVQATKVAYALRRELHLQLPILETLYAILFAGKAPQEAVPVFLTGRA